MSSVNGVPRHEHDRREKESKHVDKVLAPIRASLVDALRCRYTGDIVFQIRLNQGGLRGLEEQSSKKQQIQEDDSGRYTEIRTTYKENLTPTKVD